MIRSGCFSMAAMNTKLIVLLLLFSSCRSLPYMDYGYNLFGPERLDLPVARILRDDFLYKVVYKKRRPILVFFALGDKRYPNVGGSFFVRGEPMIANIPPRFILEKVEDGPAGSFLKEASVKKSQDGGPALCFSYGTRALSPFAEEFFVTDFPVYIGLIWGDYLVSCEAFTRPDEYFGFFEAKFQAERNLRMYLPGNSLGVYDEKTLDLLAKILEGPDSPLVRKE